MSVLSTEAGARIRELLKDFWSVSWDWDLDSVSRGLESLGMRVAEESSFRKVYRAECGVDVAVRLDAGMVFLVEATVDEYADTVGLSGIEYEAKVDEFYEKFEAAVDLAELEIGKASFSDGSAAKGFPADQEAEWVALWAKPDCRVMIEQKHEDREAPMRLCVVIAPPSKRRRRPSKA